MRAKIIFLFGLFALSILTLSACDQMNADQSPATAAELPIAPVLPTFDHLSPTAPPPTPVEIAPPLTDIQHQVWRPGHWAYEDNKFTWVPGAIVQKPAFTAIWMPDHWEKHEYGWAFVCGYWQ